MTKIYLVALVSVVLFTGCGRIDRAVSGWTGDGSETCQDGVVYLQFTSGVTVKYLPNGKIATCNK